MTGQISHFIETEKFLVYNGEIYNGAEIKRHPSLMECRFSTTGDTEILFEALSRNGLQGLTDMDGMWGFAFYDQEKGSLLAARDRYGKKPLFYTFESDRLCISSTIGALLTFLDRRPSMREEALNAYLAHGFLYPGGGESTHLRDINQVPPGQFIELDLRMWKLRRGRYFDFANYVAGSKVGQGDLPGYLQRSVISRLVSDRQVGLLLSGGIDSSLVLSVICAAKLQDSVHCFIGETGRSEDAVYGAKCAEQLGIKAEVIETGYGENAFRRFLRMCKHQEKPFPLLGNSMAMAEMYEAISARGVPVVLDGTGGDEVFGGYWNRYYAFAIREAMRRRDWPWLMSAARANGPIFSATLRSMVRKAGRLPRELVPRWLQRSSLIDRFCSRDVRSARSLDVLDGAKLSLTDAIIADAREGRLGEWIWQNDRNAMMSSIENRSPLLDFRLSPFMASGYGAKFVGPWNKHELREVFDSFIALPTQWRRQKQGFRWAGGRFYAENKELILELISASKVLPGKIDVQAFLDLVRRDDRHIRSQLLPRMLCISGLEAELGLVH